MTMYPLKFLPVASPRPWGGFALTDMLSKQFPVTGGDPIGESWELADMGELNSIVSNGFLAGKSLREIMETYGEELVGEALVERYCDRFPLLIKFLDIEGKISVQVHPDDRVAMERYGSSGKAEVWYILDAKPDARIYIGFKDGVTAEEFHDACLQGTADRLLNVIIPEKGDVIFISPGTVHAAEGGIVLCEIQESSDMTFRLYDWGRELNPSTARKMHLDEAMDIIDFRKYDGSGFRKSKSFPAAASNCIAICPQFTVNRIAVYDELKKEDAASDRFYVYSCIKGEVCISHKGDNGKLYECRLRLGETVLVPAKCRGFIIAPVEKGSELIESTVL